MSVTDVSTKDFSDDYVNPRGIPRVQFVDNVAEYIKQRGVSIDNILRSFTEQHSKYKLMEHKLSQNLAGLQGKIPEITKTLDALEFMEKKAAAEEELVTQFALTDLVFCDATVPSTKNVNLWLGANTMVEYPIEDAQSMLKKNLEAAKTNFQNTQEDLAWLRDQQIVCEVNTSRIYNYDVVQKREAGEKGEAGPETKGASSSAAAPKQVID